MVSKIRSAFLSKGVCEYLIDKTGKIERADKFDNLN